MMKPGGNRKRKNEKKGKKGTKESIIRPICIQIGKREGKKDKDGDEMRKEKNIDKRKKTGLEEGKRVKGRRK